MNWLNKMERKYGKYAIPNLMYYIIILYAFGFLIEVVRPGVYAQYLALDAAAILHGEIWRMITFIIQPPSYNLIYLIFGLYLYYIIGKTLEYVWGAFRFNLYFFTGVLLHVIAAILTECIFHVSLPMGTGYLNLALYFAYAAVYPNQQLYLFLVFPVKMKYLAWLEGVYYGWSIVQAFLPAYGGNPIYGLIYKAHALEAFVSILNFLIFFLATRKKKGLGIKEARRKNVYHKEVHAGKKAQTVGPDGARHRCVVCGRTELDDPNLEFRYCSKCNGNYEYCQDHLFTHEHIK